MHCPAQRSAAALLPQLLSATHRGCHSHAVGPLERKAGVDIGGEVGLSVGGLLVGKRAQQGMHECKYGSSSLARSTSGVHGLSTNTVRGCPTACLGHCSKGHLHQQQSKQQTALPTAGADGNMPRACLFLSWKSPMTAETEEVMITRCTLGALFTARSTFSTPRRAGMTTRSWPRSGS